jgi:3-deoxy-manno-octulosonate cytidylyltransferase (CMP-KDO synthetase)
MKSLGIIPARFASTRFPGKPLVEIDGKTMIQRVWEQVSQAARLDAAVVATDDERIFSHVQSFGGQVVMTSPEHASGTDRCAEVIEKSDWQNFDVLINIQGDEPFIEPTKIDLLVDLLIEKDELPIGTLVTPLKSPYELFSTNVIKAVFDNNGKALYFSRSPIPHLRGVAEEDWLNNRRYFKHIGMYAYRRDALLKIARLPQGFLEKSESLEQLRWLENGMTIGVAVTDSDAISIDTPEDLRRVTGR